MIFEELGKVAKVSWGDTSVTKKSYVDSGYRAFSATGPDGFLPDYDFDETGIVLSAIGARCGKCFKATGRWKSIKNTITITSGKSRDGVNIDYLYYITNDENFWPKRGVAQPFIGLGDARKVKIPLPPLAEQKRIAGILDAADGLRAKRRAALAQLDTLLQSTFLVLFGDPVGDAKRKGYLESKVEEGWIRTKLGDQITLQRGKDITKKAAVPGDVPVISSGGISFYHNVSFVKGPGVLLGRKGSVGKVHYVEEDFWAHDTTLYVREFNGNDAAFVYHFFRRFPISQYEASVANPSLNRNNLHPVVVLWPPLDLQRRFASIVESVERQKARHREHLAQLDTLFASLQQRAFKGEL